jgi:hypothetical protein
MSEGITINHPRGSEPDEPRWDTDSLQRDFTVEGFCAPFVVVRRKSDGARGCLEFVQTDSGRWYFGFAEVLS